MAKLSITVNKTRCIGSGDCVETAPAVFQLDDEGKSEVVNPIGRGRLDNRLGCAFVSGQGNHRGRRGGSAAVSAAEKVDHERATWRYASIAQANS